MPNFLDRLWRSKPKGEVVAQVEEAMRAAEDAKVSAERARVLLAQLSRRELLNTLPDKGQ